MAARKRNRWRWVAALVVSAFGLVLGVALFLQSSYARELVRTQVNDALGPLFQGKVQVERLGRMGLWGVAGVDARIFDPDGQQVIRVQGLEARAPLPRLLWQLAVAGDPLSIDLNLVRIDYADVTLREDEDFGVTLARAFMPIESDEPTETDPSETSPELYIDQIEIARVWAHGYVSGSPALDGDLLDLQASLSQTSAGFALELNRTRVSARNLPLGVSPRGTVWGSVDVPDDEALPLRLEGYLDGSVADSPLWLETSWIGDELYALARLPRLPATFVNERLPELQLRDELSVRAELQGTLPELDFAADVDGSAAHVSLHGSALFDGALEAFVTLEAARVDLAQLTADAPTSDLRLQARALVLENDDELVVSQRVELDAGTVTGIATPPAWLNGQLVLAGGDLDADGRFGLSESGAEVRGSYRIALHDRPGDVVVVEVQGQLEDPERLGRLGVRAAGNLKAKAELALQSSAVKAQASLSLRRLEYQTWQARSVELAAQATGDLADPRIHAATTLHLLSGRAHADLSYTRHEQELEFFLADIDALRLARVLGVKLPLQQGNLNAEGRVRRETRGRERVELSGKLHADLGKVGELHVSAKELELPLERRSLEQLAPARGELVGTGKLDLSQLPLTALVGLPLERATGTLRFEIGSRNLPDQQSPEVSLRIVTNGLRIVERRAPLQRITTTTEAVATKPFALEGIDGHALLRFDPRRGEAVGTIIARDRGGTLAVLEGQWQLGEAWLSALAQPGALMNAPCNLHLEVPGRRLQSLPPLIRPGSLRGRLTLDAELAGTLADPRVRSWFTVERFRSHGSAERLELNGNVKYSTDGGEFLVRALDGRGSTVGRVTTRWEGDLRHAARQLDEQPRLVANVDARFEGFPLEVVPMLVDRQVKGRLTGHGTLRDWGKDARLELQLSGRQLSLGKASLPSLEMTARQDADQLRAQVHVVTSQGAARASLEADSEWRHRPLPLLKRRGMARLATQRFELATLTPLLGGSVSELSGMLDADARLDVDGAETRVAGNARIEDGVVQVPAIGQRFSDISARFAVADNQFKLQELEGRGLTGRVSMTGAARLDGFALRTAEARVTVKKNEQLPLTIEGAALGDIWGNVNLAYQSPTQGERTLTVKVAEFHLTAPETEGHGLQSLDNAEEIRIGTRGADGAFAALPVQPLEEGDDAEKVASGQPQQPLRIRIELGPNVTVARGRTAHAQLTGSLLAVSNGETTVTGRIEVRGGKLDVQGKTFEIERGVVSFDGKDASNPTIIATARWDGPEYALYADYVGDVENGRIKLRSEPPLSQDQIASLLLFGDPDGSAGSSSDPNSAALAVMVAGDTAAKGLNQVLGDFTKLDVRARVDTTTGSARPELLWQVSPRVVAKVTRAIGEPAVGESPDRTFLALELKLRRAWALSAVFGDHGGSALDLIWRHRY